MRDQAALRGLGVVRSCEQEAVGIAALFDRACKRDRVTRIVRARPREEGDIRANCLAHSRENRELFLIARSGRFARRAVRDDEIVAFVDEMAREAGESLVIDLLEILSEGRDDSDAETSKYRCFLTHGATRPPALNAS